MIRKLLTLCLVALFAVGCATVPGDQTVQSNLADLKAFTLADLQAALADADAHQDLAASQCYSTLITVINTGLPSLPPQPVGVVSAFQLVRDLVNQGPGQAQAIAKQINLGCAALFVDANVTMGRLLAIGAGAALK